jgi:ketosteroid isomerase-like protein
MPPVLPDPWAITQTMSPTPLTPILDGAASPLGSTFIGILGDRDRRAGARSRTAVYIVPPVPKHPSASIDIPLADRSFRPPILLPDPTFGSWRTEMPEAAAPVSDRDILSRLNADYIRSVQNGDVRRFDEILAVDFRCSNPDGSLLDRAGFLAQTARPVTISNLEARDVEIRMFGDVAIIHARTSYTLADGRPAMGRYTDVWARQNGQWLCVSAHVTRC